MGLTAVAALRRVEQGVAVLGQQYLTGWAAVDDRGRAAAEGANLGEDPCVVRVQGPGFRGSGAQGSGLSLCSGLRGKTLPHWLLGG